MFKQCEWRKKNLKVKTKRMGKVESVCESAMKCATAQTEFTPATGLEKEVIDKYQGTQKNL